MTRRALSKRLERLEARAMPAGDSFVMEIQFLSPEKVVTGTLLVESLNALTTTAHAARAIRPKNASDNAEDF